MSAKLVLALIVALQVSTCMCDLPVPEKELVDKYEDLKATFYKRLLTAYNKIQAAVVPVAESNPQAAVAKQYLDALQSHPKVAGAVKVVTGVASELSPVVDKARSGALGVYGTYLRPYIGDYLDQVIQNLKPMLDVVLPTE